MRNKGLTTCYNDGVAAARRGKERKPPYHKPTAAGQNNAWLRGYDSVKEGKDEHEHKRPRS